ncbi:MAG: formate--tetrahydrofolate ligase [SAR202 cluster bacterium]|jgi:formate--tetrahydrofolate ligase|nr:formate--tetrahydrofolate ligase [SAR202 cluster bacterium]
MRPIIEVAEELGLDREAVIPYGHYKAKIELDAIREGGRRGKMVVVTGITPTPAGEGKTTTVVGLTQSLGRMGKKVVATLREPSLGPIFGIKGGGTGGGKSLIQPEDEVNIHFTGDAHAVGSAHNLLAALTDNAAQRGQIEGFRPEGMTWRRVMDVEDRGLRSIIAGVGGSNNAPLRESGFDIVTASEIMAILALSNDLENLRERISRVVVGYTDENKPVTADDVGGVGSMMALLRYAIQPNIVQTSEGQPVIVHAGPFGNIAHGCSSVVGDRLALGYADYVLSEAGFGADLGFEKFMHIKARFNDLEPSAAVLVASVRAVKYHGGVRPRDLDTPNEEAVQKGVENLEHLIGVIKSFNLPVVVALNHFPTDTAAETAIVKKAAEEAGAFAAVESKVFAEGGAGGMDLAQALIEATEGENPEISYAYDVEEPILDKVRKLAKLVYNADGVQWALPARRLRRQFEENGWGNLPVCMAKTHLSISHRAALKGRPSDYTFEVSDVRASVGAGFIYPIAGNIVTMPGLPGSPRQLDVDERGNILGL